MSMMVKEAILLRKGSSLFIIVQIIPGIQYHIEFDSIYPFC